MKVKLYAIEDKVVGAYNAPFTAANDQAAIRTVKNSARGETMFSENPADFRLVCCGVYSQETGRIMAEQNPVFVANVTDIVNGEKIDE